MNGFYPMESLGHYAYHTQRNSSSPYNPIPIYNPDRSFKDSDFYGWGNVDKLYMEQYNDANALYINGSFGDFTRASVRYNRGMESGRELLEKLRSGELTLGKDETIKIVGYSMGGSLCCRYGQCFDARFRLRSFVAVCRLFSTPSAVKF